MKLSLKAVGTKLIVSVSGDINSATAPEFLEQVSSSLHQISSLEIDLSGVNVMSSAGFRSLLILHDKMSEFSGMTVSGLTESVAEAMQLTGLYEVFDIR